MKREERREERREEESNTYPWSDKTICTAVWVLERRELELRVARGYDPHLPRERGVISKRNDMGICSPNDII